MTYGLDVQAYPMATYTKFARCIVNGQLYRSGGVPLSKVRVVYLEGAGHRSRVVSYYGDVVFYAGVTVAHANDDSQSLECEVAFIPK